jgi:endonuclease YncB( thermonuclease family)
VGLGAGSAIGPAGSSQHGARVLGLASGGATLAYRAAHPAEIIRVLDGDTFEARVRVWPGLDITTKVRLRGIDAPELRAHCEDERVQAEAARERLQAILAQGQVAIADVTLDKYCGRVVASISTAATPDVSAALLTAGLARRYDGGRRASWCG